MSSNDTHETTLRRLLGGEHLSTDEAAALIGSIMDGMISHQRAGEILVALATKGEHADEVHGAARAMLARSLRVEHHLPVVVDVVGTGGDGAGTINISTIAALVVAAAGVPVAKHGNRAASSKCGSADVLEANGLPLEVGPEIASRMLQEAGFTFLFAPRYHPAMKNVGPIRKQLGIRTIFNLLGPLTNPANATHYVIGVARPELIELIADAVQNLGIQAAAIVHGHGGVDEITASGPSTIRVTLRNPLRLRSAQAPGVSKHGFVINPAEFGVNATLEDLRGYSIEECAQALRAILAGERSPRADVVALNVALALQIAGRVPTLREGFELAREIIASGEGLRTFEKAKAIATSETVA